MNYKRVSLSLALAATIVSIGGMVLNLEQEASAQTVTTRRVRTVLFKPPGEARPSNTIGGASRDQGVCPGDSITTSPYLTAVVPSGYNGLTTQARPSVLVYVPNTSAERAFLSFREVVPNAQSQDNHYQTMLPIENKQGIVQIDLPEDAPELETGKTYQWSFVIMCDNRLRPDSPMVEGTVTRVSMDSKLNQELEQSTPLEQAAVYGEHGIWYDAVGTLAQLRYTDPDNSNLVTIWQDLLSSDTVGLQAIANQPLVK